MNVHTYNNKSDNSFKALLACLAITVITLLLLGIFFLGDPKRTTPPPPVPTQHKMDTADKVQQKIKAAQHNYDEFVKAADYWGQQGDLTKSGDFANKAVEEGKKLERLREELDKLEQEGEGDNK
jgi:hypothetical protein